jgi:hypothetical protein
MTQRDGSRAEEKRHDVAAARRFADEIGIVAPADRPILHFMIRKRAGAALTAGIVGGATHLLFKRLVRKRDNRALTVLIKRFGAGAPRRRALHRVVAAGDLLLSGVAATIIFVVLARRSFQPTQTLPLAREAL